MAGFMRVTTDDGHEVDILPGGSQLRLDEPPEVLLEAVVARIRASNKIEPARPKSLAITASEEAILWLVAYKEGRMR